MASDYSPSSLESKKSSPASEHPDLSGYDNDYLRLRSLLLGDEFEDVLKQQLSDKSGMERVSAIISEAIVLRSSQDDSLGRALAPIIDSAIASSIQRNPSRVTDVIFPILGPAIRKAVAAALSNMVQTLNSLLEQSLSPQALSWRISAWRSGMTYAQYVIAKTVRYRVAQVFLIHRDTGLLVHSIAADGITGEDPDLVSAMLTAISDFVSDSFVNVSADSLDGIRVGDLSVQIAVGPSAILALAIQGTPTQEVRRQLDGSCEEIHRIFNSLLKEFNGQREPLMGVEPYLQQCLLSQSKEVDEGKKHPWLGIIGVGLLLVGVLIKTVTWGLVERDITGLTTTIEELPGFVLLRSERDDNKLKVHLLRENGRPQLSQQVNLESYKYIDVEVEATNVHFGPLPEYQPTEDERRRQLIDSINKTEFYFQAKSDQFEAGTLDVLPQILEQLSVLRESVSQHAGMVMQIMILGFADSTGNNTINDKISQLRANRVRELLMSNGVDEEIVVAWGVGALDLQQVPKAKQRRAQLSVKVYTELTGKAMEVDSLP